MPTGDSLAEIGTFVRSRLGVAPGERQTRGYLAPRSLILPAMVASAGYETVTDPKYDWDGRRRGSAEFTLLQYTLSGQGRLTYQDETYTVSAGQAIFLHFPDDNRYWLAPGEQWEHCYVCLHGREVLRAWRTVTARMGPLVRLDPQSPCITALLDTYRATIDGFSNAFAASGLAYRLAMEAMAITGAEATPGERHPGIAAAKAWARQHATEDIGVDDLARVAELSRYHFSRRFTLSEGRSPAAYITELRLRLATRLLREQDLTIADIATQCGYADAAYFCRVFRRSIGVSPGEFRSSGMY